MKHVEGAITKETKLLGRKEKLLSNISGKTLDIGCGEGELLIKATLLGHDIIGVDRSKREIETAKETAKLSNVDIKIIQGDTENLPFEKESFDTIVMGEVIEHLPNLKDNLDYVLTFLKPGGKLLLTTPCGFAHPDADHKNFFFLKNDMERLNKFWLFEHLPFMWVQIHSIIPIELVVAIPNTIQKIEEIEYGDSKHPSLDFYIEITKVDKK